MFKNFKKFIYSNFKISLIRFNENKNYIQGMFFSNNNKIGKTDSSTLESQSSESFKSILTDDLEIQDLDNTDDNILVKEVQLTLLELRKLEILILSLWCRQLIYLLLKTKIKLPKTFYQAQWMFQQHTGYNFFLVLDQSI